MNLDQTHPSRYKAVLLRKGELAKRLGVNIRTIDRWRKRGDMPTEVRLSPKVVGFRLADIEQWLADRQAEHGSAA
ncbi:MAG TPA: helix-turn-helix domain-containing protein [Terriglobia bacterium]|nr:helix-turn-helix domain-containing protein [Terriglobia bacterium]